MIEIKGNLWDYYGRDLIAITTNGNLNKYENAILGKGCALEAKQKFPKFPKVLGRLLRESGNHVYWIESHEPNIKGIVTFPVKHNWWDKADVKLIERSCLELVELINESGYIGNIIIPRPGCGVGGLQWNNIKPILQKYFDNRYNIISYKGEK